MSVDARTEDLNLANIARRQFEAAVPFTAELEGWRGLAEWIFLPEKITKVNLPIVMDDGYVHTFLGYRVLTTPCEARGRAVSASTPRSTRTRSRLWRRG